MYGKNAVVEIVRRSTTRILRSLSTKHSILSEEDIESLKDDFNILITHSQPSIEISYEDFFNQIRNGEINSDEISYKIKKITESFIKYGKNIYNW